MLFYYIGAGILEKGLGYFKHYLQPLWFMFPFNLLEDFTRPLSLSLRLFGNILAGELIILILISLVPVLAPVPMMLLNCSLHSFRLIYFLCLLHHISQQQHQKNTSKIQLNIITVYGGKFNGDTINCNTAIVLGIGLAAVGPGIGMGIATAAAINALHASRKLKEKQEICFSSVSCLWKCLLFTQYLQYSLLNTCSKLFLIKANSRVK